MNTGPRTNIVRLVFATLVSLMAGCATIRLDGPRPSSHALAQPEQTALGQVYANRLAAHPNLSGFHVLANGTDAALARIALADAAERTLDLQYFIVQNDVTTALLLRSVVSAAQRGVRVRILLDDLHGPNREFARAATTADPRIELRLFNPFLQRGPMGLSRLFELIGDGERLNQRMHIKLWIADNAAGIFGGRNLGDEYFDARADANFTDLDLLAVGPLVPDLSRVFDEYWNSQWAVPAAAFLDFEPGPEDTLRELSALDARLSGAGGTEIGRELMAGGFLRQSKSPDLPLVWAPAYPVYDKPAAPALADSHVTHLGPQGRTALETAQSEVILISPYFVPSQQGLRFLAELRGRGLRVAVLTNSLASTDALGRACRVRALPRRYAAQRNRAVRDAAAGRRVARPTIAPVEPIIGSEPACQSLHRRSQDGVRWLDEPGSTFADAQHRTVRRRGQRGTRIPTCCLVRRGHRARSRIPRPVARPRTR